ncbi:MAG: amidohydrolase [Clostridium sp.]|nr:amidohydrolase [Clostridium sp.]
MKVDANMYWIPEALFTDESMGEEFLRCIPAERGVRARYEQIEGTDKKQIIIEEPAGYQNLNYVQGEYEVERQLKDMDAAGVDKAVLKIPCAHAWLSLEMCKKFNDGMAAQAKKGNGRLAALAAVPPHGGREAIYELERCVKELGMTGVQLSSHYGNKYLDDELFRPFLKKVNELKLPVYVHHSPIPVDYSTIYDYNNLRRSYGRCMDQTIAIGREVFSGMFDELPDLKLVHSMLGGAFFSYMNSMFRKKPAGQKDTVSRFDTDTDRFCEQIHDNIYYEMSHAQPWGRELLECAVKILGADHILFGSSYPVRAEWLLDGPAFVEKLNLTEEEKALMLGENAEKIYRL